MLDIWWLFGKILIEAILWFFGLLIIFGISFQLGKIALLCLLPAALIRLGFILAKFEKKRKENLQENMVEPCTNEPVNIVIEIKNSHKFKND